MKNDANSPSKRPNSGEEPISIRINLVIHERSKQSGQSRTLNPRADNNGMRQAPSPSSSVPLSGGSADGGRNPLSRHRLPASEKVAPANHPSPHPTLEGPLDRNRLAHLLAKKRAEAKTAAEPDIEITLVLYV